MAKNGRRLSFDPEGLVESKREWMRMQAALGTAAGGNGGGAAPGAGAGADARFFEQFLVVGAPHTLARRFAGASPGNNAGVAAVPPHVLVSWPPKADATDGMDVCSFCFPNGVPLAQIPDVGVLARDDCVKPHPVYSPLSARKPAQSRLAARTPNVPPSPAADDACRSPLASPLARSASAGSAGGGRGDTLVAVEDTFAFLLKDGRADGGAPLWGACAVTLEAAEASVGVSGALTKRCYVLLTRWPCFQWHFSVLHALLVSGHGGPAPPYIPQSFSIRIARMHVPASQGGGGTPAPDADAVLSPAEKAFAFLMDRDDDEEEEEEESDGAWRDDDGDDGDSEPSTPPRRGEAPAPEADGPSTPQSPRAPVPYLPSAMLRVLKAFHACTVPNPGATTSFRASAHLPQVTLTRRARRRPPLSLAAPAPGFAPGEALSVHAEEWEGALPPLLRHDAVDDFDAVCVASLCHHLDVPVLLELLAAVLLERQVLVVCPRLGTLTACMLALLLLLRPFQYQSVFLPVLPPSLVQILDAPVPYLVGMQNRRGLPRSRVGDVVVANLHQGAVRAENMVRLPGHEALAAELAESHAALRASSAEVVAADPKLREHAHGMLAAVRAHLAGITSDVLAHSIADVSRGADDRVAVLMKDSFVESFAPGAAGRAFMSQFVDTQAFAHVADGLLSASACS